MSRALLPESGQFSDQLGPRAPISGNEPVEIDSTRTLALFTRALAERARTFPPRLEAVDGLANVAIAALFFLTRWNIVTVPTRSPERREGSSVIPFRQRSVLR